MKKIILVVVVRLLWVAVALAASGLSYRYGFKRGSYTTAEYISHHMDSLFKRFDSVERKYPCH